MIITKGSIGYKVRDTDYKGYQQLIDFFAEKQKLAPISFGRNKVGLTKEKNQIYLQFRTKYKAKTKKPCNCQFTEYGIINALNKANLVADKLRTYTSELEFWQWYDEFILEKNSKNTENDLISFKDAITNVENYFFGQKDKKGLKRDQKNQSDIRSYNRQYNCNYKLILDTNKTVDFNYIVESIKRKYPDKYLARYQEALIAFIKLCEINNLYLISEKLEKLKLPKNDWIKKTRKKQNISLDDFIIFLNLAVNDKSTKQDLTYLEHRKAYFWLFSMQVIYGLRIADVLAVKNVFTAYIPADDPKSNDDDTYCYQALTDITNQKNVIYVGNYTCYGNKCKTGKRVSIPFQPIGYPNLIELFKIKENAINPLDFWDSERTPTEPKKELERWSKKWLGYELSSTHAFRRLANANGIKSGISQEIRAASLGHSVSMNDKHYKTFSSETKIDMMLNSKKDIIKFEQALGIAKELGLDNNLQVIKLIKSIYQID